MTTTSESSGALFLNRLIDQINLFRKVSCPIYLNKVWLCPASCHPYVFPLCILLLKPLKFENQNDDSLID